MSKVFISAKSIEVLHNDREEPDEPVILLITHDSGESDRVLQTVVKMKRQDVMKLALDVPSMEMTLRGFERPRSEA